MPIYEYRCPNGHTFEMFQRFADAPIEVCQECGTGPVEKILFPVAVHFKGSGFYATDYGRAGQKSGKDADSGPGSGDSGSSGGEKSEKSEKSSGDGGSGDKDSGDKGSGADKGAGGDKSSGGDTKKPPSKDS